MIDVVIGLEMKIVMNYGITQLLIVGKYNNVNIKIRYILYNVIPFLFEFDLG